MATAKPQPVLTWDARRFGAECPRSAARNRRAEQGNRSLLTRIQFQGFIDDKPSLRDATAKFNIPSASSVY